MRQGIQCQRCGAPFEVGLPRWQGEGDGPDYRAVLRCSVERECRERQRRKEEAASVGVNTPEAA